MTITLVEKKHFNDSTLLPYRSKSKGVASKFLGSRLE